MSSSTSNTKSSDRDTTLVTWSQAEISVLLDMAKEAKKFGGKKSASEIAKELSRQVGDDPNKYPLEPRRGRKEGEDEFTKSMVEWAFRILENEIQYSALSPENAKKAESLLNPQRHPQQQSMAGPSRSHVQQQKPPTFEPPSQEAMMAFSGPPGLPDFGSIMGSHSHRGTPQQVNALAMIGTSSSQYLHAGAHHPSMHSLPSISSQRAFHPLGDHLLEQGPDLPPSTEPIDLCTPDSEPPRSQGQGHQHGEKGKLPALELNSGGNHHSSSHHHA